MQRSVSTQLTMSTQVSGRICRNQRALVCCGHGVSVLPRESLALWISPSPHLRTRYYFKTTTVHHHNWTWPIIKTWGCGQQPSRSFFLRHAHGFVLCVASQNLLQSKLTFFSCHFSLCFYSCTINQPHHYYHTNFMLLGMKLNSESFNKI